jgi:hypothetical protein
MVGTEPDRIMHILNMALVEILSPKALVPEVMQYQKSLLLIYFQMYQSLLQYLKKNVIAEEHISTVKLS